MFAYSWYAVSVRSLGIEQIIRPDHLLSCVGPHARTKIILIAWIGKHEVPAADLSDDVCGERGAGKCSQCERVHMRESSSNVHLNILLYFYIVTFTSYI